MEQASTETYTTVFYEDERSPVSSTWYDDPIRTLKVMTDQSGGKKFIYVDASDGAICKMNDGNELNFYRFCRSQPDKQVMLSVMP